MEIRRKVLLKILSIFLIMLPTLSLAVNSNSTGFTLHTSAFSNVNQIPKRYTCDGEDISPALDWNQAPPKSKSLALLMADLDAPSGIFYHWVLYNIPPTMSSLTEGINKFPQGLMVGKTSWGKMGYKGPCPPSGIHRYTFTLYALDTQLNLPEGADAPSVLTAIQNHVLNKTELTTTYSRTK